MTPVYPNTKPFNNQMITVKKLSEKEIDIDD